MRLRNIEDRLAHFTYAFFVAAIFLFLKGYQFNTDDQAEHLPQVYQMMDPALYQNDYFVNASNAVYTVRHFYEQLVLLVAGTVGLEWGLFILTLCCIALTAYSFLRIALHFFEVGLSAFLAPILIMLVFYGFTVGGNHIMYSSFISSTLAKALAAFGLWQFIRRKLAVTGFLIALATLFQPLVGLQLFGLLVGISFMTSQGWRRVFPLVATYLPLAAVILVPVLSRQFAEGSYDAGLYYEVLYRFRNHHHYLPGLFPLSHYVKFAGLLIIGVASYWFLRPRDNGFFPALVALVLFGILVYVVGLEVFGLQQLGKTQWFKTTIWVQAFSAIMLAGLLGQLLVGILPMASLKNWTTPIFVLTTMVLLFLTTHSHLLPNRYDGKYMIGDRTPSDLEKMHLWIAENTTADVSVLVSPDNNGFSCQAKRSMPVHYQAIIHEPFFMLPWYEKFTAVYGASLENLNGTDARKMAADLYRTRNYQDSRYGIDLRLDNLETCEFIPELGPLVHQEGDWVLTEFVSH